MGKYCMTVIHAHGKIYVLMPLSSGIENDKIRFKLTEQYNETVMSKNK